MTKFINDLKERKIGHTLVLYLGSGWVVIEAVNFFVEKFELNSLVFTVSFILVLAGLPAALLISWFHGKPGEQTITKTEIILQSLVVAVAIAFVSLAIINSDTKARRVGNDGEKSIAVLPFKNVNNDVENEFISDGITDDIITKLSQLSEFKVISRTSSFYYKGNTRTVPEIGKELGVSNILEGTVRRSGDQLRITAELVDVMSDESLWVETFDRNVTELFAIQSEVAERIAKALRLKLSPEEEARISSNSDFNLDAYEHHQKGLALGRGDGTLEEIDEAVSEFNKAISIDPKFSPAYVGLANAYLDYEAWGRKPLTEVVPKARTAALKAIDLNGSIGEAYYVLAVCAISYEWDIPKFLDYIHKATLYSPNFDRSYEYLGTYYRLMKDTTNALKNVRKAAELDPMSTRYLGTPAFLYALSGYPDRAIRYCLTRLKEHPDNNFLLFGLGQAYTIAGENEKAIEVLNRRTTGTYTNWCLGYAYGKTGRKTDAEKVLNYLLEKSKTQFVPPIMIGYVYVGLGENEKALDQFEKILDKTAGLDWISFILWDKRLDELRAHPRFVEIRKTIPF
jgi:TolB-like protein/Tfp pilus assembly protein PilF